MRVLFVCPWEPWPAVTGGKTRTLHLLHAAAPEVELTLRVVREPGAPAEGTAEAIAALEPRLAALELLERGPLAFLDGQRRPRWERWFHSPALVASLARDLAPGAGRFDVVHLDELSLARTPPASSAVPLVQHHHKLDLDLARRVGPEAGRSALLHRLDVWKLARLEALSTRRTPHHVVCSEEDAAALQARRGALSIGVVPNGFDPGVFRPAERGEPRQRDRLLFVGSMDYAPNVDGVRWFVSEVLPRIARERPEVVLDVVGGNPVPEVRALAGDRVRLHGRVDSVVPWLRRASAMVVPLRIGGGTRLKIAEALGVGTPSVSTRVGAEGLALEDREQLHLADSPEELARRTLELLARPEEAAALGARGRQRALERLTWDALGRDLVACWRRAASS